MDSKKKKKSDKKKKEKPEPLINIKIENQENNETTTTTTSFSLDNNNKCSTPLSGTVGLLDEYDEMTEEEINNLIISNSDDIKVPASVLLTKELHQKRYLLRQLHKKSSSPPSAYLEKLKTADNRKLFSRELERLRVQLTGCPLSWINEFNNEHNDGLNTLISCLNNPKLNLTSEEYTLFMKTIRAFANHEYGIKAVAKNQTVLTHLLFLMDSKNLALMQDLLIILIGVLYYHAGNEEIYHNLFVCLDRTQLMHNKSQQCRFLPFVDCLSEESLSFSALAFLDVMIAGCPVVTSGGELQNHLQFELLRLGLDDKLEDIIRNLPEDNDASKKAISIRNRIADKYFDETNEKLEGLQGSLTNVSDLITLLHYQVTNTPMENHLLSILQHFLLLHEDTNRFCLITAIVEKLVVMNDLRLPALISGQQKVNEIAHKLFDLINIDQILQEGLVEVNSLRETNEENEMKLNNLLVEKQELEVKYANAMEIVKQYMEEKNKPKPLLIDAAVQTINLPPPPLPPPPPSQPSNENPTSEQLSSLPPPSSTENSTFIPPPPPPPPNIDGVGIPLPPPPPPPPGPGGIPPPPPPPPVPGPGLPFPPPPPPGGMTSRPMGPKIPPGIKLMKVNKLEIPVKKVQWTPIVDETLPEESIWFKTKPIDLMDNGLVTDIMDSFAMKQRPSVLEMSNNNTSFSSTLTKKVKRLHVLDGKISQNLSIVLGSMKISHDKLKEMILQVNTSILNVNMLEQLLRALPSMDDIQSLCALEVNRDELLESEHFIVTIGHIKSLDLRLQTMIYKEKFQSRLLEVKSDIATVTESLSEITKSTTLLKFFEFILFMGNIMNAGTRTGNCYAFDVKVLTRLNDTKDKTNKRSLLHFVVEKLFDKFPTLQSLNVELNSLDRATKVSLDQIKQTIHELKLGMSRLEGELANYQTICPEDQYAPIMQEFHEQNSPQMESMEMLMEFLQKKFLEISIYLSFDSGKYSIEELLLDMKTFKDQIQKAQDENEIEKERCLRELQAQAARDKRPTHPLTSKDQRGMLLGVGAGAGAGQQQQQQGVLDNMMDFLKSSSTTTTQQATMKRRNKQRTNSPKRSAFERTRSRRFNAEQLTVALQEQS